jgi:hypothetical protein
MKGGTFDILTEEGTTLALDFEYLDASSVLINISSYVIRFIVKSTTIKTDDFMFEINSDGSGEEGTILYPSTSEIYGSIVKGTTGKFTLTINSDTMALIKAGTYFYNLSITTATTVTSLCKGRFEVESSVK